MTNTDTPNLPQMMLATLYALKAMGGSGGIQEIDEIIIEREGISEAEQAILMPNDHRAKLKYYLAWARTYLKRGGALENSARGVWAITDIGEAIQGIANTKTMYEEQERERARMRRQKTKKENGASGLESPAQLDSEAENETTWKDELLDALKVIEPTAFERLSQRLLREAGFIKVEVRGQAGDGGIDGIGVLRVNLVSFQIYFQCKRWKGSVGSKDIRDFRGAL